MQDHAEPTETEDELASTERHSDEEGMRGPHQQGPPDSEEDDEKR